MSNIPLVSVVIPTFNRAHCLPEAIDSVLKQSYRNYEIIVVDDGSGDDTKEKLNPYANQIRYFYQKNRGVSSARNRGIRESRGEWIAFLDSDDVWQVDKLKVQIQDLCANPNAIAHMVDEIVEAFEFNQKKYTLFELRGLLNEFKRQPVRKRPLCDVLLAQFFTSTWMLKRNLFENAGYFDPDLCIFEDFNLLVRFALQGPFVVNCYVGGIIRRQKAENHALSNLYQNKHIESLESLVYTYKMLKCDSRLTTKEYTRVCRLLGGVWIQMAEEYKKRRKRNEYISSLIKSINEDPGLRGVARAVWHATGVHNIFHRQKKKGDLRRSAMSGP